MRKFSPRLTLVSLLAVFWAIDRILAVARRGETSSFSFYDFAFVGVLFPVLVLISPRVACWSGMVIVILEMLASVLLFAVVFVSWADPLGVNFRLLGFCLGTLQTTGSILSYCAVRFALFGAAGILLLLENCRTADTKRLA